MKHLDLFAGIGGFSLAARWAGWETVAAVEWNPYCQAVLKKNFPDAVIFGDIRTFNGARYAGQVDIITGGFPCQPYSQAGKRAGNDDDRALWPEMLRVIREVAPAWVVGENVAGLLTMDGGRVLAGILADLENAGYRPEIYSIPAVSVGAPHERERIWIVAHRDDLERNGSGGAWGRRGEPANENIGTSAHRYLRNSAVSEQPPGGRQQGENTDAAGQNIGTAPHCQRIGRAGWPAAQAGYLFSNGHDGQGENTGEFAGAVNAASDAHLQRCGQRHAPAKPGFAGFDTGGDDPGWNEHWFPVATRLCRVDDGIPAGLDGTENIPAPVRKKKASGKGHRLEALGNAIVPQVAFQIFDAINQYEQLS